MGSSMSAWLGIRPTGGTQNAKILHHHQVNNTILGFQSPPRDVSESDKNLCFVSHCCLDLIYTGVTSGGNQGTLAEQIWQVNEAPLDCSNFKVLDTFSTLSYFWQSGTGIRLYSTHPKNRAKRTWMTYSKKIPTKIRMKMTSRSSSLMTPPNWLGLSNCWMILNQEGYKSARSLDQTHNLSISFWTDSPHRPNRHIYLAIWCSRFLITRWAIYQPNWA